MELKILSGGAANGLVDAVRDAFREATGLAITGDFGAVGGMRDRVLAGEAVDLVILSRKLVDDLVASGHLDPSSVADLGRVATGVAVREGQAVPDVSSAEALKATLLEADAVYVPDMVKSTAGIHVAKVLDALGVRATLADRLRTYPNGQTALGEMVKSDAARPLGLTQITEILNVPGVAYAGDLPPGHDLVTTYTAGVLIGAAEPVAAGMLIAILTAPERAEVRASAGFGA